MYTPCVLTVYVGIFSGGSLVGSPCKVGTWIHVILHTAPYERTRRGDHLAPSPQLTIRANCLNLEQKKCKFPYDQDRMKNRPGRFFQRPSRALHDLVFPELAR